jgi:fumarate hydratase class II
MATALNPVIGYSSAAEISKEAYKSGRTVKQVAVKKGILKVKDADRILEPGRLTGK